MEMVEDFVDGITLYPQDVPVFTLDFLIPTLAKRIQDAVLECSLKLY
jgi:hypothetical protein